MRTVAYREQVEFLADANPVLIEQNANEFRRLHRLIDATDEDFRKATSTDWQSEAKDLYVKRLREAQELVEALGASFGTVAGALTLYADAVATAKEHYASGKRSEKKLSDTMAKEATAITSEARSAEPLRQWEDLRATTGVFDYLAEATADVDAIREDAERFYDATKGHYQDAYRAESEARTTCLAQIRSAYRSLPDFRGGAKDPGALLKSLAPLRREAKEAADAPDVQLPGTGRKVDTVPALGDDVVVTEKLMRIATRVDGLPDAKGNNYWLPSNDDEGRRAYIRANRELINAAAADSGLPPEMVAGIAWQEVEGDPAVVDDIAFEVRKSLPGTEDPDKTSMGPMAIQVRRAAEVLGYDPDNLDEHQRGAVVDALNDPGQNIFIASEYLAQLKAESGFADVPPEDMTREQMQQLAARYNGGPHYESEAAQGYGRGFTNKLDQAAEALK